MHDPVVELFKPAHGKGSMHWIHLLWSIILLLGSMVWFESSQAQSLRKEVALLKTDNVALRKDASRSDQSLRAALSDFHKELNRFHDEMLTAQAETGASITLAQAQALKHADALAHQLEVKDKATETQQRQLSAELSKVKESTADTVTRVAGISKDVGSVKQEVETVRSSAEQVNTGIALTRDDIGAMNGLVATNAAEIHKLRELGTRNVFEFKINKAGGMQRVGDIQVLLSRTDPKHNRFTVEIQAADQKVEQRDRNINEPVQFYVPGKSTLAYELVVNEVGKDTISGYLSTPKVTIARNRN